MKQTSTGEGYDRDIPDDPAGLETLELFSGVGAFNGWMFGRIKRFCTGKILEIGSGIGNLSSHLLRDFRDVSLSDIMPGYLETLAGKFDGNAHLKGIYMLDLGKEDNSWEGQDLAGRFDTVVALNVIEHIRNDGAALRKCFRLLRPGGKLVMLVPAYRWLFNNMDKELGHFRRYKKKDVACLLEAQDFRLIYSEYFNAAAIVGWWVSGSLLRKRRLGKREVALYNRLIPLARLTDHLLGRRVGISVIAVAVRPESFE